MAQEPEKKNQDAGVSTGKKLGDLYRLIDGIEIAMMTTRQIDGSLVSRPMAVQERREGVDLWFVTTTDGHMVDEIRAQPEVNLAFYKDKTREWVSVSGTARLDRDPERIRRLYKKDWKIWMGDEGDDRSGGPNDPRIILIEVDAHAATYMKSDSRPMALFRVARALVTRKKAELGSTRHVDKQELNGDTKAERARDPRQKRPVRAKLAKLAKRAKRTKRA